MNVERLVQLELFLAGSVEGYAGSSVANTDAPSCRDTQREPAILLAGVKGKTCKRCGIAKDISRFDVRAVKRGPRLRNCVCLECKSALSHKRSVEKYKKAKENGTLKKRWKSKEEQNAAAAKQRARMRALPYDHPLRKKWRDYRREWDRKRRERERPAKEAARNAKEDERTRVKEKKKAQRLAKYQAHLKWLEDTKDERRRRKNKKNEERRKRRAERDPTYKLTKAMRARTNQVLRCVRKTDGHAKLLGCDREHLRKHIEVRFQPGMTWENYGLDGWTVDHITPCAAFNLSDPEQQRVCFHYTNLQPLWSWENSVEKNDSF